MKSIKFNKKYDEGTRWSQVVSDFIAVLSKSYGYQVDEFDLISMVWQSRIDMLAPLVDKDNAVANGLFNHVVRCSLSMQEDASQLRQESKELLNVLNKKGRW